MSSAVIYETVLNASPFVAAAGLAAGAAFYLYFRYSTSCDEKEQAREQCLAELNRIEYLIRRDIDALPLSIRGDHEDTLATVTKRKGAVMQALERGDAAETERLLASLAEDSFLIRKKLGEIELREREEKAVKAFEVEKARRMEDLLAREAGEEERLVLAVSEDNATVGEIVRFHCLLGEYDERAFAELVPVVESARTETLPQRLSMIRDMVRLRYGKARDAAATTIACRRYILAVVEQLRTLPEGRILEEKGLALADSAEISRAEYAEYAGQAARLFAAIREEALLVAEMKEKLSRLGYSVPEEEIGDEGKLMFDTRWDDYKVLVRIGKERELAVRLARVVATEKEKSETTEYQLLRDTEVANEWCRDLDRFSAMLREKGFDFRTVVRKEPGDEGVICLVDPRRATRTSTAAGAAPLKEKAVE